MPVDEVHRLINAVDNNKTEFNSPLFISKQLRELLEISEPSESIDKLYELQQKIENMDKKQTENLENMNKKQTEAINELKQQKEVMQKLLTGFIKNSKVSYNIKDKNEDEEDDKI